MIQTSDIYLAEPHIRRLDENIYKESPALFYFSSWLVKCAKLC
jgi:hypothetical protein